MKGKTYKYQLTQQEFDNLDGIDKVYYKVIRADKRWVALAKIFGMQVKETIYQLKQI